MEEATVTGVSEEIQEPTKTKFETDYEAIVARRDAEMAAERQEPEEEPKIEDDPTVPMVELVGQDGSIIKVPATARYRAKVDGNEMDVDLDKVFRGYQKGAAADKRLEEASKALKEIEAKQRDLTEREQAFVTKQGKLEEKRETGTITEDAYLTQAKNLLAALTDEDEQSPETRIAEWIKSIHVDPEQITSKAKKELMAEVDRRDRERELQRQFQLKEQARNTANTRFMQEYKDIVEDRIAYAAAKTIAQEKYNADKDADPWELAKAVGDEIRKAIKPAAPVKPTTPKTASARATIGKDEKPETRSDIINQMKALRGQPA